MLKKNLKICDPGGIMQVYIIMIDIKLTDSILFTQCSHKELTEWLIIKSIYVWPNVRVCCVLTIK